MSCTFKTFDVEILKYPLPYKYVVFSPKTKRGDNNCYEYLHAHAVKPLYGNEYDFNRCLHIPQLDHDLAGIFIVLSLHLCVMCKYDLRSLTQEAI